MKFKRLIFLTGIDEAEEYMRSGTGGDHEDIYIAMNPRISACLKRNGIIAYDTTRYFTNSSHEEGLKRSKEITDYIRRSFDIKDEEIGINNAYEDAFVFWIRLVIQYCIWVIEIIENAIKYHKPDIICASISDMRYASSMCLEPE